MLGRTREAEGVVDHVGQQFDRVAFVGRRAVGFLADLLGDLEQQVLAVAEVVAHQRRVGVRALAGDRAAGHLRRRQFLQAARVPRQPAPRGPTPLADAVGRPLPLRSCFVRPAAIAARATRETRAFDNRRWGKIFLPQGITAVRFGARETDAWQTGLSAKACTISATAFTAMCSRTGPGAGRTPGLVTSHGETLLIDTLMSVPLTRDMLGGFRQGARRRQDRPADEHARQSRPLLRQRAGRRRGDHRHAKTRAEMEGFNPQALGEPVGQLADHGRGGRIPVRDDGPLVRFQRRRRADAADHDFRRARSTLDGRRQDGRADRSRPGAYRIRHDRLGGRGPHGLHRRSPVQRRAPGGLGRSAVELDRRVRLHHRARTGGGGARPRPDQRRRARCAP